MCGRPPIAVWDTNCGSPAPDADGGVTIRFGIHLEQVANALPIMPGWNHVLRLYRPRPSVLDGTWTAPRPEAL